MRELPIAEKTRQSGCHYDRIYVSYSFLIDFFKVIAIQKLMGFLTKPNTEVVDGCCLRATVSTRAAITLVSCSGTQSSFTSSPCTCASYTRNLVRQYDNSQLNGVSDQEKWTIALWYYLFIYIWWLPSMHTSYIKVRELVISGIRSGPRISKGVELGRGIMVRCASLRVRYICKILRLKRIEDENEHSHAFICYNYYSCIH